MKDIVIRINDEIKNGQNIDIFTSIIETGNNKIDLKITTQQEQTKAIKDIINYINENNIISIEKNNELYITNLLHELGLSTNIKGYSYIKEGIRLIYHNPKHNSFTKEIYPIIAKKYDSNIKNVERNIRHAIDISWNRGNWDTIEEIFGYSIDQEKAKPTSKEYIITIADILIQKNKAIL